MRPELRKAFDQTYGNSPTSNEPRGSYPIKHRFKPINATDRRQKLIDVEMSLKESAAFDEGGQVSILHLVHFLLESDAENNFLFRNAAAEKNTDTFTLQRKLVTLLDDVSVGTTHHQIDKVDFDCFVQQIFYLAEAKNKGTLEIGDLIRAAGSVSIGDMEGNLPMSESDAALVLVQQIIDHTNHID